MDPMSDLKAIYWHAVREVDPLHLVRSRVRKEGGLLSIDVGNTSLTEDLSRYARILVLGMGKASTRMAMAAEEVLGEMLTGGCVITKYGHALKLGKVGVMEAGHPVPDANSVEGANTLARLAADAGADTLIINLVSGGGSSLLCLPAHGITLSEKQEATNVLLASGADIDEVNCVRKHISLIKGGRFAAMARPARLISLILSDVVGDRLDTIASGITSPDPTTYGDALSIIENRRISRKMPPPVMHHLASGRQGHVPETPKAFDKAFERTSNIIIGSNTLACRAALAWGTDLGYHARILSTTLTGEAGEIAEHFAKIACDIDTGRSDIMKPALVIAGGETTVTLRGDGLGGRNQEMALAFAYRLHGMRPKAANIFFLSAGTDGTDGPTDAAGAFVTPGLTARMHELQGSARRHLDNNDAYRFFQAQDLLFTTGPTHTNVCDLQLLAVL